MLNKYQILTSFWILRKKYLNLKTQLSVFFSFYISLRLLLYFLLYMVEINNKFWQYNNYSSFAAPSIARQVRRSAATASRCSSSSSQRALSRSRRSAFKAASSSRRSASDSLASSSPGYTLDIITK